MSVSYHPFKRNHKYLNQTANYKYYVPSIRDGTKPPTAIDVSRIMHVDVSYIN